MFIPFSQKQNELLDLFWVFYLPFVQLIMPRVEFTLWDRVYILKLICTVQMTYSSFITMLYIYLIILQSWTSLEGERPDTLKDKWIVIGITVLDFGMGTLLAFAANMVSTFLYLFKVNSEEEHVVHDKRRTNLVHVKSIVHDRFDLNLKDPLTAKENLIFARFCCTGQYVRNGRAEHILEAMRGIRCRRRIVIWIILETLLIPLSIFLLVQLHHKITTSKQQYLTDTHYSRISIAQVCFIICNFFFIAYGLDFLATHKETAKTYDPSIRPESVYAPTDPQITTTESRHIRMSQSFLFQSSTSKDISKYASYEMEEFVNMSDNEESD